MKRTLLVLACLAISELTVGVSLQKEGGDLYWGPSYAEANAVYQACKPDCTMTVWRPDGARAGVYRVLDGPAEETSMPTDDRYLLVGTPNVR